MKTMLSISRLLVLGLQQNVYTFHYVSIVASSSCLSLASMSGSTGQRHQRMKNIGHPWVFYRGRLMDSARLLRLCG